jgi:hypothetical protein
MADYGQYQQMASTGNGGWQAVVELCGMAAKGLMFWSRRRFAIGAELLIRVRCDVIAAALLPEGLALEGGWTVLHGHVVDCTHLRREDGSQAYRVALLLDGPARPVMPRMDSRLPGHVRPGLN